jgi:hypothetical protein
MLLVPQSVSLELDVDAALEKMRQALEHAPGRVGATGFQGMCQQLSVSAGEAVEPRAVLFEILPIDPRLTLGSSSGRMGQQSAKVAVANATADEKGETDFRGRS